MALKQAKFDRAIAKQIFKICIPMGFQYSLLLLLVFWGFGRTIMSIFVSDTAIIENAVRGIHITSIFFIALGMAQILRYLLNGVGDSAYSMVNGIVEIVCRLVFVFLLTNISFRGQWGIWWTTALTWLCTALFAFCRFMGGKWKDRDIVK